LTKRRRFKNSSTNDTTIFVFRMGPINMISSENKIIAATLLAGLCGFVLLGIIETVIGLPGQWGFVVMFLLLVLFGSILPQLYLIKTDQSVSKSSRLGVVTLVLVILAAGFSGEVTGAELAVIWGLVGISIALIVITEVRKGYQQSAQNGNR